MKEIGPVVGVRIPGAPLDLPMKCADLFSLLLVIENNRFPLLLLKNHFTISSWKPRTDFNLKAYISLEV